MAVYKQYFTKEKGREFPIYGYSPPPNGQWQIDDTVFTTDDFRTVEKYREYKDCGFNVLFLQYTAPYRGEGWDKSETKKAMDNAVAAGLDKVIIVDTRIFELSLIEGGIIGEGKKFASEDELDRFIADCIKDYSHEKAFYGLQLRDEPFYPYLKTIGQIFRSIRRVDKGIFVHCNLNPLHSPSLTYRICEPKGDLISSYENYLSTFLEETGTDHLMMDTYPFFKSLERSNIGRYYFAGLECVARVCKKYGVEMHIVMQSFAMNVRNRRIHLLPTEREMQFQKNVLLSFGVKQYSYFTYWTKQMNRTDGEMFLDGKAMMTRSGQRTRTWYHVQRVNKELNELAPMMFNFDYCAHAFIVKAPFCTTPTYLELTRNGSLSQTSSVETDKEIVLITELYDKKNKQYMYCAVNTTDIKRYEKKYGKEKQLTALNFNKEYNVADVYCKGKWQTVALEDGKLEIHLYAGDGIIILPYKENK